MVRSTGFTMQTLAIRHRAKSGVCGGHFLRIMGCWVRGCFFGADVGGVNFFLVGGFDFYFLILVGDECVL